MDTPLPPAIRLLNWAAGYLERAGAFRELLSVDSIMRDAKKNTGLSDWGAEGFTTALELLTQPDTEHFQITHYGKRGLRSELVRCLENRLLIQDEIKRHPETQLEKISRPLFIVSLPRTGSTLLQRLLSLDPNCRPLLHWETFRPAPAPDPKTHHRDPRIKHAERETRGMGKLLREPSYAATHMSDATQPEECWFLLQNTLMFPGPFSLLGDFPKYFAWQQKQDMAKAYAYYKLQLQILQRNFPPAHWVLKSSEHLSNLATLLSTFPDASFVRLHRDPAEVVPSLCNITIKTLQITNALSDDATAKIPRLVMDDFLYDLERAEAARKQADPSRFLDIHYRNLVRDPVSEIRKICEYFGYAFSGGFETRIIRWLDENPKEKHGAHTYSLEQFGLTREEVRSFFADHCEENGTRSG